MFNKRPCRIVGADDKYFMLRTGVYGPDQVCTVIRLSLDHFKFGDVTICLSAGPRLNGHSRNGLPVSRLPCEGCKQAAEGISVPGRQGAPSLDRITCRRRSSGARLAR
jgi:hypothetical protein